MIYLVEVISTEYDNVSALDRIPKREHVEHYAQTKDMARSSQ